MGMNEKRLENVYRNALRLPINGDSKIVLFSDCHRGQGDHADNFLPNQNLFFSALEYYYDEGFTYIELGDGDELWENRKADPIIDTHSDAFWLMEKFYCANRLHMLYGNHDVVKRRENYMHDNFAEYYCDTNRCHIPLFPGIKVQEGIVLEEESGVELFLTHGHQGDRLNDKYWTLARFLVRYLWRPLEMVGVLDPTGAGRKRKKKEKIEKRLADYAKNKEVLLVAGHTHRPYFSKPGEGYYFNDGSCVHPRCITGIEIKDGAITLMKWCVCTRHDRTLYICREVLEGPVPLAAYC